MIEIDGQTIYFKRLVMKTTFTYDPWIWGSSDGFQKIYSDLAKIIQLFL